jgi:hypothetical protein
LVTTRRSSSCPLCCCCCCGMSCSTVMGPCGAVLCWPEVKVGGDGPVLCWQVKFTRNWGKLLLLLLLLC